MPKAKKNDVTTSTTLHIMEPAKKALYVCAICYTQMFRKVEERATEAGTETIECQDGHIHDHDCTTNDGWATLLCENGHQTRQKIIWKCWCGWDSKGGRSSCVFKNLQDLWGNEEDDW